MSIDTLEELVEKIDSESLDESVTKRHLLAARVVEKELGPMVKYASPDILELQNSLRYKSPYSLLFISVIFIHSYTRKVLRWGELSAIFTL